MPHGSHGYGPPGVGGNGHENPRIGIDCYVQLFPGSTCGGAGSCRHRRNWQNHPGNPWRSGEWRGPTEDDRGRDRGRPGGHDRGRYSRGRSCEHGQSYKRDDFPLASRYRITVYQPVSSDGQVKSPSRPIGETPRSKNKLLKQVRFFLHSAVFGSFSAVDVPSMSRDSYNARAALGPFVQGRQVKQSD